MYKADSLSYVCTDSAFFWERRRNDVAVQDSVIGGTRLDGSEWTDGQREKTGLENSGLRSLSSRKRQSELLIIEPSVT